VDLEVLDVSAILTRGTGFMDAYDYSLNPYMGCEYGCTYCYAAFFARSTDLTDRWGYWVTIKRNAIEKLRRMRTDLTGASIYMSSVTDPYQPIERDVGLTRALVEELIPFAPRLVVQTRSGVVVRDLDLLLKVDEAGGHTTVNITITTDSSRVRRAFEPRCPTNKVRLDAAARLVTAGVDTAITLSPLLPIEDVDRFADDLLASGVERFVVQPFHPERGRWVRGTREEALALTRSMGWDDLAYRRVVGQLQERLPVLLEGKEGFAP
jgi:DNA repair photolyase